MDHSVVTNRAKKIFHGLTLVFVANSLLLAGLLSAKKPATQLKVAGASSGSSFRQSNTLIGANATPTAGTRTIEVSNAITPGCILRILFHGIPLGAGSTLDDGPYYDVYVEHVIQSGATLTTAAQAWKAVINIAIAGTGSITNGRIYVDSLIPFDLGQIGTGLSLKYAAVTGAAAVLTLNGAATGGTRQNEYDFTVEVLPKPPGLLGFSTDTLPTIPGIGYFGASNGASANFSATEQDIDTDQAFEPLDSYVTATAGEVNLNALEDLNARVLREIQQIGGVTSTDSYDIFIPNFYSVGPTSSLILINESQEYPGNRSFALFREVRANNLQISRQKTHQPMQGKFKIIKPTAEDIAYFATYRPSIAA